MFAATEALAVNTRLNLLLRHRLLRQPGGFECCLNLVPAEAEHFSSHDLPAADPVGDKGTVLKPSIAPGHPTRDTSQGDHLFAAIVDPVDFPTPVGQQVP